MQTVVTQVLFVEFFCSIFAFESLLSFSYTLDLSLNVVLFGRSGLCFRLLLEALS